MEMFVTHETPGNTHLGSEVIERHRGEIDAAAAQLCKAIADEYFKAANFVGLTAVAEYAAIRDRVAETEADLHRLANAESDARDAIHGRFRTILASAIAEHAAKDVAARERLATVIGPLLNELAALENAGVDLGMRRDLEPRVDEFLRTVQDAGKR
jgi:hypothetical protein